MAEGLAGKTARGGMGIAEREKERGSLGFKFKLQQFYKMQWNNGCYNKGKWTNHCAVMTNCFLSNINRNFCNVFNVELNN